MNHPIARVSGEMFDADQVSLPCETCGLNEYVCECDLDDACQCGGSLDANGYCAACDEIWDTARGWAAAEEAALKRRAA